MEEFDEKDESVIPVSNFIEKNVNIKFGDYHLKFYVENKIKLTKYPKLNRTLDSLKVTKYDDSIFFGKKIMLGFNERKKILTEIEFLSIVSDSIKDKNSTVVVYQGNSNHLKFVIQCFPQFKFHIYDPNCKDYNFINLLEKVEINRKVLDISDVENESKNENIVFISTLKYYSERSERSEPEQQNSSDQIGTIVYLTEQVRSEIEIYESKIKYEKLYHKKLNSQFSMFDFNLPFGDIKFFDGDIYIPPWNFERSKDTKIIVTAKSKEKNYNSESYNEKMNFFLNSYRRSYFSHSRKFYCHCFDCTREYRVLQSYIDGIDEVSYGPEYLSKQLSRMLHGGIYPNDRKYNGI